MDFSAFLSDVLTPILDHPQALKVDVKTEGRKIEVMIYADPKDRGRIIGKSGRMISSLRTLVKAAGEKAGVNTVNLELYDEDEEGTDRAAARGGSPRSAIRRPADMMLLGHLAKIQGLKGEFLLHEFMDDPSRLTGLEHLALAPPDLDLEGQAEPAPPARTVRVRSFRYHQDRPCVAFQELPDRTASEPYRGLGPVDLGSPGPPRGRGDLPPRLGGLRRVHPGGEGGRSAAPRPHPHGL